MAEHGSWPSIARHGLLSTSRLLDLYQVDPKLLIRLQTQHRPESVEILDPILGRAVVRDQKPMNERVLARVLDDGLKPADWFRVLNKRAFFWVSLTRLKVMMNARAYRENAK